MSHLQTPQARSYAPLLSVRQMCAQNGPPLHMGQQLCWCVLHVLSYLSGYDGEAIVDFGLAEKESCDLIGTDTCWQLQLHRIPQLQILLPLPLVHGHWKCILLYHCFGIILPYPQIWRDRTCLFSLLLLLLLLLYLIIDISDTLISESWICTIL